MLANELFEEKQNLVFAAIKQQFGSSAAAGRIAEKNNMELVDLVQVGQMVLWKLCLKYDPKREATFNGYVVQSIKWAINNELLIKGKPIRVNTRVSFEERENLCFHSIDLHKDGETKNEYFAVSPIDMEEEVIRSIEFEEILSPLDREERFILMRKGFGFTDAEIAQSLGKSRTVLNRIKNRAFLKVNPNYKPNRKLSILVDSKPLKARKNHQRQLVI